MCWLSQPSSKPNAKISIDVSGLPDQENSKSPFFRWTSSEKIWFVYAVVAPIPLLSSAILITGIPLSEKFIFLKGNPFFHVAKL